jgi:hypothetical protein
MLSIGAIMIMFGWNLLHVGWIQWQGTHPM